MRRVYITGSAGFIGFHLARHLLALGWQVHGFDGMTDYYDVALKRRRHAILHQTPGFSATEARLEDAEALSADLTGFAPEIVVHLAAQAGVRYSLEAPQSYISANLQGTFNLLEAVREARPSHFLAASTSSIYGGNRKLPFAETDRADGPLSLYAATKKAAEALCHSYAHLHDLPTTAFRFFTVYGPWGRPDMALFKFTAAILENHPIDVYGHGRMGRDFTYVTDLVRAVTLLIDAPPLRPETPEDIAPGDSLSPDAPYRVVNIGNGEQIGLETFIEAVEAATGRRAERRMLDMQKGDVPFTWADTALLQSLTGYRPETPLAEGVRAFVEWYRDHYGQAAFSA